MKKLIPSFCILHFAFCIATVAHGAAVDAMTTIPTVTMTSISARQRYPWNGKVDIDFSFTCDNPDAFAFIHFKATYVNKAGVTTEVPMKTFDSVTNPWCTNAGTYHVTWDSCADAPDLQITNLTYTVTANMAKYMIINLSKGTSATADDPYPITYMEECPDPTRTDGGWTDEYKTTNMVFRLVQPGKGKQGWGTNAFTDWNCCPYQDITITRPYYLAIFECTQGQAKLIHGSYFGNQSHEFTGGKRDCRPVAGGSWNIWRGNAADGYCWPNDGSAVNPNSLIGKLRIRTGNNVGFDMPTEAEWEYAARAGATDAWGGDGLASNAKGVVAAGPTSNYTNTVLAVKGRYMYNGGYIDDGNGHLTTPAYSADETHGTAVVGSYEPNAWGFYDMLGNVRECTLDYYSGNRAACGQKVDPVGVTVPEESKRSERIVRVLKGGHWNMRAQYCTFPFRNGSDNHRADYTFQGCRIAWRFPTPAQEPPQE